MKIVHEQILFDCLAQFEAGVSAEALMAQYPQAATEIEKFLAVAAQLQQVKVQPSLAARQQSQKLFLQQAAEMRAAGRRGWFSWRGVQRTLLPLASLAMVTILLGATLLFASTAALPGDVLYDTKRWLETVQVQQATDATAVFSLKSQQNEERIRETKSLLRTQETAVVSFEGRLNAKQGSNWVIGGLAVQVTAQTQVAAGAEVGALLGVNGRTTNGQLFASQITVLQTAPATATPAATVTGSAVPTATPSQSAPTATITATASPTKTATPTITATPGATGEPTQAATPTATLTAPPTATATPDATLPPTAVPPTPTSSPPNTPPAGNDNNNDNGNDNADDGSNSNDDNNSNDNANDNDDDDDGDNSGSGGGGNNNDNDNDNADEDD